MKNHDNSAIIDARGNNKVSSLSPSKASQEDSMRVPQTICSINGCERPHKAKSYCSKHYTRLLTYGDANYAARPATRPYIKRVCSIEGCTNKYHSVGYCGVHRIHALGLLEHQKAVQKAYRERTNNAQTHRYEKTPNGFLMRVYRNMIGRVTGIQPRGVAKYKGLDLLPKEDFYAWAKADDDFWSLFKVWEESGYNRKLTPSINRIDTKLGYVPGNIEWLTTSENSRRGAIAREYSWDRWNNKWVKRKEKGQTQ